jgi:hypothetical protein
MPIHNIFLNIENVFSSVADPECLSRILIFTHPGSRISDLTIATKEEGVKICCPRKYHRTKNYFIF